MRFQGFLIPISLDKYLRARATSRSQYVRNDTLALFSLLIPKTIYSYPSNKGASVSNGAVAAVRFRTDALDSRILQNGKPLVDGYTPKNNLITEE